MGADPMAAAVQTGVNPQTIPGWGVDADLSNNPTFPMRDRAAGHERGLSWPRPAQQPREVEVLMSIEHNTRCLRHGIASARAQRCGAARSFPLQRISVGALAATDAG